MKINFLSSTRFIIVMIGLVTFVSCEEPAETLVPQKTCSDFKDETDSSLVFCAEHVGQTFILSKDSFQNYLSNPNWGDFGDEDLVFERELPVCLNAIDHTTYIKIRVPQSGLFYSNIWLFELSRSYVAYDSLGEPFYRNGEILEFGHQPESRSAKTIQEVDSTNDHIGSRLLVLYDNQKCLYTDVSSLHGVSVIKSKIVFRVPSELRGNLPDPKDQEIVEEKLSDQLFLITTGIKR